MPIVTATQDVPATSAPRPADDSPSHIEKVYRTDQIETVALTDINLDVREGEFISIMGPSGCGKSTLLNVIGLLDVPTSGTVELGGTAVASHQRPRARAAAQREGRLRLPDVST